jgi:tetratricopeptide (TPR) repeat protein
MLNKALRTMEVNLITTMGFFVRDLHEHIAALHSKQYGGHHHSDSFTVYRGQGLSQTDFNQLQTTHGGLLAFNNFLSTSLDRAVSLAFAESITSNPDLIGVLFEINIDPSISSTSFANVKNVSYFQEEEEILFSMHSVFRIGQVKQIEKNNNRLWQVDLTLTGDHDPQLQELTKSMQDETEGPTGWFRLGLLMMRVAQFDKAQQVFEMILDRTTDEEEKGEIYHYLGWIKQDQGKYTEAITYYEMSLKIRQNTLPANHPHLAGSYNNLGLVYNGMGECSKALSYYEKALEIDQKTLPANHPHLATSYNNIGGVYRNMGEYSKALSYYEKDLEIYQKTLPANHPDLATSYNNIGEVYRNMGEYSKALSYYEKALEILQKTLPANHPHLASSYNNIGGVYHNMGEYLKALSYYEKALEIYQKTLPANHPDLATSYNNIASVYVNMGEYSKALSYYEKSLEILQRTLPANHPHFASSYNNIGAVYDNMDEYLKALSYYERALDIFQASLPPNHPSIKTVKESIEIVKKKCK